MDFSNLDPTALESDGQKLDPTLPDVVPGRVLHIDADFLSYQCGYRWEEESLQTSITNLLKRATTLQLLAGAERHVLHLTRGTKGGREDVAMVQEYQENRKDTRAEGLKERVHALRAYMGDLDEGCNWWDQEADDGLCQAMWEGRDNPDLVVMWSMDKDLDMVGGLHLNDETAELVSHPWGFGECWIDRETTSTKVKGRGTSFFWHQMLMGDYADNIPGLGQLTPEMVKKHCPPKYLTNAYKKPAKTAAQKLARKKAIAAAEAKVKAKSIGPVLAHELLEKCKNDLEAFVRVRGLYTDKYSAQHQLTTWRGDTLWVTAGDMMLEQARLLWMRRTPDQDVMDFFKEMIHNGN